MERLSDNSKLKGIWLKVEPMKTAGEQRTERRLAAILAADVVGYSRLMGVDEEGTHLALKEIWREVTDPSIKERRGRVVKTMGDGLLVEFASVVDAVVCAVDIQRKMIAGNQDVPADRRIVFRIGINLGDIIIDDDDIFGDGVNVAARLETLAEPGGICISQVVRDQIHGKLDIAFVDQGERQFKNIARPVRAFRVWLTENPPPQPPLSFPDNPSAAAAPLFPSDTRPKVDQSLFGLIVQQILDRRALLAVVVFLAASAGVVVLWSGIYSPGPVAPASPLSQPAEDRLAAMDPAIPATRSRTIGDPVFFERDKVVLPRSAGPTIDRQAAFLHDHPMMTVTIKTYCSPDEGAREGTRTLAELRANQLRDALKARGVAGDRIKAEPACHVGGAAGSPDQAVEAEDRRAELLRD